MLLEDKSNNIKHYVREQCQQLLVNDDNLRHISVDSQPTIIFKNHHTISDKLITARFPKTNFNTNSQLNNIDTASTDSETHKCKHRRCKCCNFIIPYYKLKNKILQTITIPNVKNLNCNTNNLIYLINCNKCNLQYIGQTSRKLKERFTDHFSNIKTYKNTAISIHFNQPSHTINNFTITPLQTIKMQTNTNYLNKKNIGLKLYKLNTQKV